MKDIPTHKTRPLAARLLRHSWLPFLSFILVPQRSFAAAQDSTVKAYLDAHCIKCHGADTAKGDFRIDTLSSLVGMENTPQWLEIMERINSGEMPPKKVQKRPSVDESAAVVAWIAAKIKDGEAARMAARGRVSYNRLTRDEYVNTVRDLIGVHYDAKDPGALLDDPEWHGFERIGSVLTVSPSNIDR
jgi:mono/diheme cytochrome c family protein